MPWPCRRGDLEVGGLKAGAADETGRDLVAARDDRAGAGKYWIRDQLADLAHFGVGEPEVSIRTDGDPGLTRFPARDRVLVDEHPVSGQPPDLAGARLDDPKRPVGTEDQIIWMAARGMKIYESGQQFPATSINKCG
jgi:hypothetical protein